MDSEERPSSPQGTETLDSETENSLSYRDETDESSSSDSSVTFSFTKSQAGSSLIEDGDSSDNEFITAEMFADRQTHFFRQMMFVSGETAEPSVETTTLIEDIVRQQVVEIVRYSLRLGFRYVLTQYLACSQHRSSDPPWSSIHLY
jgi:transcription initiation protein SPT3